MGKNSTEVAYSFGQLGSAHTDAASQVRPPKGMVIVAIQFLADNVLSELTAEVPTQLSGTSEYIGTAVAAHDTGDTTSTASTSGSSTTLTLGSANALIKPGMIIESQGDTDIPVSLTNPTKVVSYDGATTVVMSAAHNVSSQTVGFFHERGSGFGGIAISGANFPKGMTIYGRWTSVTPAADADGGIICYFGI
jgi:hypothetical protein|tara:strand:+ start:93 stop:671 length:579 start_codon:yes stop_codon:yes gene_type:complete